MLVCCEYARGGLLCMAALPWAFLALWTEEHPAQWGCIGQFSPLLVCSLFENPCWSLEWVLSCALNTLPYLNLVLLGVGGGATKWPGHAHCMALYRRLLRAGRWVSLDKATAIVRAGVPVLILLLVFPNTHNWVKGWVVSHPGQPAYIGWGLEGNAGSWMWSSLFYFTLVATQTGVGMGVQTPLVLSTQPSRLVQGQSTELSYGAKQPDFIFPVKFPFTMREIESFKSYTIIFLGFNRKKTKTKNEAFFPPSCRVVYYGRSVHLYSSLCRWLWDQLLQKSPWLLLHPDLDLLLL